MKNNNRRNFLKAAGASLVAASAPAMVFGQKEEFANNAAQLVYLSGCGWNRSLPGVLGQACFSFDMRAEVGGTGLGTLRDDVYPEVNSQIQINSVVRRGREYTLTGEIIASRSAEMLGLHVTVVAESLGDGRGRASITLTSDGNLVVIAIIAILIGFVASSPR